MKSLIARLCDALLMALLVLGSSSVQTFAAVLVWAMFLIGLIGVFTLTVETAKALQAAPTWKLVVAWAFHLGYVAALLHSGRPILAACYLIMAFVLRVVAAQKLKEPANG